LTDLVEDAVIEKGLTSSSSLAQKAEYLVALANKTGGKDNITVVLAHVR
jgi:protein phosphatase